MNKYQEIKKKIIALRPDQIVTHEIPSLELILPKKEFSHLMVGLYQEGEDSYVVGLTTNPDFSPKLSELYNSKYDLGMMIPEDRHRRKAEAIYLGTLQLLKQKNYKIHVFYDGHIGIEEIIK